MKNLGVSVIICCYNSASRLPETIRHLALQQVPKDIPWEINIIDNASTDQTANVAREEWQRHNLAAIEFKVTEQMIPGKTHALLKGIDEAKYEYILICDDDNWLNPGYIATAFHSINGDPAIGILGGMGTVTAERPLNMDKHLVMLLNAHGPQTWATADHWVYGAGSLLRKSIFKNLINNGWQQIASGRTGSNFLSGEDVEFCFMYYLCGYKIIADDRLTFEHFISRNRQNQETIYSMAFWLSYSYYLLYSYLVIINKEPRSLNRISFELFKQHGKLLLRGVLLFINQKLHKSGPLSLEQKSELLRNYGMVSSIIKNRKKVIRHNRHILHILKLLNEPSIHGE